MKHLMKFSFGYNEYILTPEVGSQIMALMQNALIVKSGYSDDIEVVRGNCSLFSVTTIPAVLIEDIDKAALLDMTVEEYQNVKQRSARSKKEDPVVSQ
jgi:hypothetical protein